MEGRNLKRREFLKNVALGGVAAGAGAFVSHSVFPSRAHTSPAQAGQQPPSTPIGGFDKPHTDVDLIPGVREQGNGLKCYVESDYAPLKACPLPCI